MSSVLGIGIASSIYHVLEKSFNLCGTVNEVGTSGDIEWWCPLEEEGGVIGADRFLQSMTNA